MKGEKRINEFLVNKSGGVYVFIPLGSPRQRDCVAIRHSPFDTNG